MKHLFIYTFTYKHKKYKGVYSRPKYGFQTESGFISEEYSEDIKQIKGRV